MKQKKRHDSVSSSSKSTKMKKVKQLLSRALSSKEKLNELSKNEK